MSYPGAYFGFVVVELNLIIHSFFVVVCGCEFQPIVVARSRVPIPCNRALPLSRQDERERNWTRDPTTCYFRNLPGRCRKPDHDSYSCFLCASWFPPLVILHLPIIGKSDGRYPPAGVDKALPLPLPAAGYTVSTAATPLHHASAIIALPVSPGDGSLARPRPW